MSLVLTGTGGFHGINVAGAEELAAQLALWSSHISQVQGDVALAEGLAELSSDLHGDFEKLSRTGSELAHAITAAATELTAHQLTLSNQFMGLRGSAIELPRIGPRPEHQKRSGRGNPIGQAHDTAHAQNLLKRRRLALAAGQTPSAEDDRQLTAIVYKFIADDAAAATAYALALNGAVPIAHALGYDTVDEIEADFTRVLRNMAGGTDPTDRAIPVDMYPDQYRAWIASNPPTSALTNRLGPRPGRKPNMLVPGLLGQQYQLPRTHTGSDKTLDDWQIASAIAAHLGPVAYSWLGRTIAPAAAGDQGFDGTLAAGQMAAMDPATAVAMFNALGPERIAHMVFDIGADPTTAAPVLASFAQALAAASNDRDLGFTGYELVAADDRGDELGFDFRYHQTQFVEQLLAADGYDPDFLIDATIGSFEVRHEIGTRWPAGATDQIDPRNIALGAIAAHGASRALFDQLGPDRLGELLAKHNPATPWHDGVAQQDWNGGLSPIERVFTQLGAAPQALQLITDAVGADPERWTFIDDNPAIANGLSIALAMTSPTYVPAPDAHHGFIETYDRVLHGGSGAHMTIVESQLVRHEVRRQLTTTADTPGAAPALDLNDVGNFLGKVAGTRDAVYNDQPELAGLAADKLMRTQDGIATALSALGVIPSQASTTLGVLSLAVAALPIDGTTALEGHLLNSQQHTARRPLQINLDVVDATLAASPLADSALPHNLRPDTRLRQQIRQALTTNSPDDIANIDIPIGDSTIAVPSLLVAANAANNAWGIAQNQTFAARKSVQRGQPTVPPASKDTSSLTGQWDNDE